MHFLSYILFLFFTGLFAITPFWILYRISDFIYLLFWYIFEYRKKVVLQNLANSFPEKTIDERKILAKKFYRHLCDILVEGIKVFTMKHKNIIKRHKILNPNVLDNYFKNGNNVIAVSAHYGNWEWGAISGGLQTKLKVIGIYKPLSNPYIDKYLRKTRARGGTELAPMSETVETFNKTYNEPCAFVMIADQSPTNMEMSVWMDFLNQETACLHGPEKYAKKYNLPIVFLDIQKVKRGYYHITVSDLVKDPQAYTKDEITITYMKKLEEIILKKPEYWLWSHKRWKKKRERLTQYDCPPV